MAQLSFELYVSPRINEAICAQGIVLSPSREALERPAFWAGAASMIGGTAGTLITQDLAPAVLGGTSFAISALVAVHANRWRDPVDLPDLSGFAPPIAVIQPPEPYYRAAGEDGV